MQKVMAQAGLGSRRACEEIIKQRRVRVNGELAVLGQKVNRSRDQILVDGRPLACRQDRQYIMLNKPVGYITSAKDQFGRKTVLDLVAHVEERIYPVGRLDYDSEGLVLLTNDGQLAHRVMHPRFELPKTYRLELAGRITPQAVARLRAGVVLDDGPTLPARVRLLHTDEGSSLLELTISEGRNRQIRRMCQAVGFHVKKLVRTAIGPLKLGDLASGQNRALTAQEIERLREAVGDG